MSEIQTARRYKYEKDEEYKILRLLFGKVIIFARKMPKIKVFALIFAATVLLMFATGILSMGYVAVLGDSYVGTVISRDELYPAASAACNVLGDDAAYGSRFYPCILFMKKRSGFSKLYEGLLLADGRASEGVSLNVGDNLSLTFSSRQAMLTTVYEYMRPYINENTISAVLDGTVEITDGVYPVSNFSDTSTALSLLLQSLAAVETTEKTTAMEKVERPVQSVPDSTKAEGEKTVTNEGADGSKEVSRLVTKKNGVVTENYVIDENILTLPVAKVESVGTKVRNGIGSGSFLRPVSGKVTSVFGTRWGRNHDGIDYAGNTGEEVKASDSGTVIFCGPCEGYGKLVIIDHGNGFETYYGHLNAIYVSSGEKIISGKIIGEVGNSGNSTGPHLHFEIRKNGTPQNPDNYLAK